MGRPIHAFDNGVKVYDDHLLDIQRERYNKKNVHEAEEEELFLKILRSVPSDGVFVNIGAAIGYYPILAKNLIPGLAIHAVEPLARHRQFLVENLELNGLSQNDIVMHTEAISSTSGEVKFRDRGYGSSLYKRDAGLQGLKSLLKRFVKTLLRRVLYSGRQDRRRILKLETIKSRTLDEMFDELQTESIDLCQMDVQGFETEILKGAGRVMQTAGVKTFLIGTHSPRVHQECIDVLSDHGYHIEYENYYTTEQPDGILIASKGCRRFEQTKE